MIKVELKTVRNEKGNPQADNMETQNMMKHFWVLIVKVKLLF